MKTTALPTQRTPSTSRAPAGKPLEGTRVVTVGGVPLYLDQGRVVVELTLQEVAVAFAVASEVQARPDLVDELSCLRASRERSALSRAITRIAHTVNAQVTPADVRKYA